MDKHEAEKRIEKLRELINYHRRLYHIEDRQEISDFALDSLKKELFDLEQKFPELITPDSPTQRVAGRPLDNFVKIRHIKPMISFNDAFLYKDMEDWQVKISKLLSDNEVRNLDFYCELKIDGLAIELVYESGTLKIGSTRGNGEIGEDVTNNLKTIEAIPLKLNSKEKIIAELEKESIDKEIIEAIRAFNFKNPIIVRGEAFISKKEFEEINKNQVKSGLSIYSNPRNLAAGSIRQLNPKVTAQRKLDSFAYEIITDFKIKTHEQKHKILAAFGFKTNIHNEYCKDLKSVNEYYKKCEKLRNKIPYEIDGVVVIVNSNEAFEKLGVVGKAPRGAIAFKFPTKQSVTIVEYIKVQIGRTGALTPVAILKPVEVGGVIVSRATLHNEDEIERLGIKIKDTVIVGRAGDVIPDIIKVLPELRTGQEIDFKMPSKCPICSSPAIRKSGESAYYCSNPECFAQQKEYFNHFVSRSAYDMRGLGPKILSKLIEEGLISDPADLFALEEGDLLGLERFAEKSAGNVIKSIQGKKSISFPRFIYGLGIRNVGEKTSADLANFTKDINNLKELSKEDLERISDVGPVVADSVFNWFRNKKNIRFLEKLFKFGVKIDYQNFDKSNLKFNGLKFVLTGTLPAISREKAKEKIKSLGGEVTESVSKNTDYIIRGDEPGSKIEKAKELNIKIINEKEFLEMIEN